MNLLHNGYWQHSATEEGTPIPGTVKIGIVFVLLLVSFFISGCDTEPLKPDTGVTDFWEHIIRPESRAAVSAMVYTQNGELLLALQNTGLQRYRENANGSFALTGVVSLPDNRINELFSDSTTGFVYAGTFGGSLFRSTDFGGTWRDITPAYNPAELEPGFLNYCAGIAASPNYELFAAFNGHGIFYSTDFGSTWSQIFGPPQVHGITSIALTPELGMYVGTQSEGIFQGGSFADIPFWTVTTGLTPHVTSIIAVEGGAYIGTNEGRVYNWQNEQGFNEATSGSALPGSVMDMQASPGGALYIAAHTRGVWRIASSAGGSTGGTGGGSAAEVNIALIDQHVQTLSIDNNGHLLAGTATEGVFRSVFPVQFYDAREIQ